VSAMKLTTKTNKMNKFTITFRNALGELITEDMTLKFNGVTAVTIWFENTLGLRVQSISKH
jgi:hypothetical protein